MELLILLLSVLNSNKCVSLLKLEEDQYNEEARRGLDKIEPTRQDIFLAKAFVRGRDYGAAIELITRIIEVST